MFAIPTVHLVFACIANSNHIFDKVHIHYITLSVLDLYQMYVLQYIFITYFVVSKFNITHCFVNYEWLILLSCSPGTSSDSCPTGFWLTSVHNFTYNEQRWKITKRNGYIMFAQVRSGRRLWKDVIVSSPHWAHSTGLVEARICVFGRDFDWDVVLSQNIAIEIRVEIEKS